MSEFDELMHELDGVICAELGKAATLHIDDKTITSEVIIDEDVAQFGDYGEVIGTVHYISVLVAQVGNLKKGTRVESQAKAWLIDQLEESDGSMARYSMKKA